MTDTKQSRLTATLLCVTPPDEHQEQGIRAFLQKKYGEDVALTIQQDSSLKSGFQLHVGSEVYDWSAKGRMEQFRQQVEQLVAKNTRKDIIPLLRSSIDEFRLLAKSSEDGTGGEVRWRRHCGCRGAGTCRVWRNPHVRQRYQRHGAGSAPQRDGLHPV